MPYFWRRISEPYSLRALKSFWISGALRPSCATAQGSRSNFARLPEKRAFRLGFAALSAPPFALRTAVQRLANPFFSAQKRKIRHTPMSMPYFWRRISEPYSLRALKSFWISGALRPSCATAQGSRSNFARLPEKRAFRLGFAALSAPPFALRTAVQRLANPFFSAQKRKIRHTPMSMPYFWRRRKDLNLRAGCPTYTLSRGASSPLEYFSIQVWLSTCHNSISTFFLFVNRFFKK